MPLKKRYFTHQSAPGLFHKKNHGTVFELRTGTCNHIGLIVADGQKGNSMEQESISRVEKIDFVQQKIAQRCVKFFIVIITLTLASCNLVDLNVNSGYIDPELKPYVDSFVEEAAKRGISVNTDKLKISFKNLNGKNGTTFLPTNTVHIDGSSSGWINEPERVVFHELGHLYLNLDHDNSKIGEAQTYFKSIMASEGGPAYRNYPYKRPYYVDELFDRNTPDPIWCNN